MTRPESKESAAAPPLDPRKFRDPERTVGGDPRAVVPLERLETLWFNTGTLCNLACAHCYIESSPRNDRLVYLTLDEVRGYLDEIEREGLGTEQIGFTGGEPFLNRDMLPMLALCLERGYRVLVLTNAMRPMQRRLAQLEELIRRFGDRLAFRVSVDHHTAALHEQERGPKSWEPTIAGLQWLARVGARVSVAGRTYWDAEDEQRLRQGYARLFEQLELGIDAFDPAELVLFPEMDERLDVPEISERCWAILGKRPSDVMCARSRMVVHRKGDPAPVVVSCTLLPYDRRFEMGRTLREASAPVVLNHPHCARFCVLGGASCSPE
ncbi:MAG: radical SAM protein [Planctomycetota bacterium]|nr:MAG: radical SAM protein [Planctomycetota bacterium]